MIDFFRDYPFLFNAFCASLLISLCAGIIGSLVVSSKSVFLTGGVAHSAFGGVGIALFFGFSTMLGASLIAILMALLMAYVTLKHKNSLDSYIAALWAFGMAIGVICIDLSKGYGSDLSSYLFGSIIAVSTQDLIIIAFFDCFLILFISIFYTEVLSIFYDREFCQLKNINTTLFLVIMFILMSLGVVMSMSVAGLILVISILSIPAYIASFFALSLKTQMILSSIFSLIFIWSGFGISYAFDLSIGACVVIVSVCALFFLSMVKKIVKIRI
ncbi:MULTISPECIES: metal ABC transporter permease [unclassified Helicobacter]|uniref:metal ABC transporter permease n=1 Tax=unclassified Helicobacter TaxID=2593540 RepID=UPI000CF11DD4|nr:MULTISPECIES: metal ABC transporter permease [unclassified Helicobacter]